MFRQSRPFSYSPRSVVVLNVLMVFIDEVVKMFFFLVKLQRILSGRLHPSEATFTAR